MFPNVTLRSKAISLIKSMINEQVITAQDLSPLIENIGDPFDPEYVRQEMEKWYKTLGIESLIDREFTLSKPSFTREELKEAHAQHEIILCTPRGITRKQFGILFNLTTWALDDELITDAIEVEDFWFTTKQSFEPYLLDKTGLEIQKIFDKEGKLGMSLSRYMTFIARMRYITGKTPDTKHRVWLTRGRYDQKGMLIAGFDSNSKFSVHGWLPQFRSPRCGARYVSIADHL